jgi:hypothetical protein
MPAARRLTATQSEFVAKAIARLVRNGFIKHAPHATMASPGYPVNKHNVDPTAPIEDQMRFVVDCRTINACTRPTVTPIPNQALFSHYVAGASFFGKLDFNNGFFQMALDEESKQYMNILTDRGVYESQRLIQGSRNAAGPFHAAVAQVLEEHIGIRCLLYIDDVLIFAKTAREFIDAWKAILQALHAVGFKVHAKKTVFFAEEVLFCGRLYSKTGVRFNPEYIRSVTHMSTPITVDQLRTYLASANWMRGGVARFSELAGPLNDILTTGLAKCKRPTQRAAQKVVLAEIGWNHIHDAALEALNKAIAADVMLACPDHKLQMCMYTDASDLHWAGIVTQCVPEELNKPPMEQHHFPLAFVSGSFDEAQKKWPTIEKEGFAIKTTTLKCAHLLHHPKGFKIFTDHANLGYLFNPNPALAAGRRQAADRIERWLIAMRAFNYDIQHIKGVDNVASDMLSRWASVKTAQDECQPLSAIVMTATATTHSTTDPDTVLMFDVDDVPTESELRTAQQQAVLDKELMAADYNTNSEGLLVDKKHGRVFVPDSRHLRLRLCIIAHQGRAGHRGYDVTYAWLSQQFTWPNMADDVKGFLAVCLSCVKTKGGRSVPRVLLHTTRATAPNTAIHFDYMHVREPSATSSHKLKYILVVMDCFSRYTELVPAESPDSDTVVNTLLAWFHRFGIPLRWTSDRGTHFLNQVLTRLATILRANHHFTASYSPWSNGVVERRNRDIRQILSAVMLDAGLDDDQWPQVLPVVNAVINHAVTPTLAGHAPITVFTGHQPTNPLGVVYKPEVKDFVSVDMSKPDVQLAVASLQTTLKSAMESVHAVTPHKLKQPSAAQEIDFGVGDFVVTARRSTIKDKTRPIWEGPAVVIEQVN